MRCERTGAQGSATGNRALLRLRGGGAVQGWLGLAVLALWSVREAGAAGHREADCAAEGLGDAAGDCGPASGAGPAQGAGWDSWGRWEVCGA